MMRITLFALGVAVAAVVAATVVARRESRQASHKMRAVFHGRPYPKR